MDNIRLKEFLNDTKEYNIFSYEEYKKSSLDSKLLKIKLLNEYSILKYQEDILPKLDIFIDFDGVILDTLNYLRELLLKEHNIDLDTHNRNDLEKEKKISNIFGNLNWTKLINNSKELNKSIDFIKLLQLSNNYNPTIYSAVNSKLEEKSKILFLNETFKNISSQFIIAKLPKTCKDNNSILVDDDDFNLINWPGKPIHFNSNNKTIFPSINDLGEIYYLFTRNSNTYNFKYPQYLYDNYIQIIDKKTKKLIWTKK